jgi:uncharacterized membrane protein required for colicin V production
LAFAIDLVAVILLGLGLLRGWLKGFVTQIGQLAALAVAWILAELFGPLLEPAFRGVPEIPPMVVEPLGFLAAFLVVYALGSLAVWRISSRLREASRTLSSFDRLLGLGLGGLKGAVMIYLAVIALMVVHRVTGKLPVAYASSHVGRFVMRHNILDGEAFPRAKALVKLGWLLRTHAPGDLAIDPHFGAMMAHPKAAFLWSPEMAWALATQDWPKLVADERVWDLLDEPEVQAHLNAMEWDQAPAQGKPPPAPPVEVPWVPMPYPPKGRP